MCVRIRGGKWLVRVIGHGVDCAEPLIIENKLSRGQIARSCGQEPKGCLYPMILAPGDVESLQRED